MKFSGWVMTIWLSLWLLNSAQAAPQVDLSRTHFNRGVELQQKGDLEGARQAYEEALKHTPHRVDALANLGLVYLNLGRNEKANEHFEKALSLQPELPAVRMFLGLAEFRAGQFAAAYRELIKVIEAQPSHPQALHLAGLCLLKLDKIQEGINALEAALQAKPDNTEAAYTLATAYVGSGAIEKAEALLEGPLRHSKNAEVHLIRGSILNAKKEANAALQELATARQLNDKLPTLRTQMGYAYLLLADYEPAANELLAALKQTPDDFHANAYLGWLYIQEKRYGEAAERLALVLRQQPDNATILYQLGHIHQINGQAEQAAALLERVVKQRPDFVAAHVILARVYLKLKRTDDFTRAQAIIRQLTEAEQERSFGTPAKAEDTEVTLSEFSAGLSPKPALAKPVNKDQK